MAKGLTDDELLALTDNEMRNAIGVSSGKLAEQRRKAEYYYLGLAKEDLAPPEIDGRSAVVVPVVRNTIESMLPQLMVKFTGGDKVVEFDPTQADDEKAARNCTEYLNYLFFKKNNGHNVTYSWFKDALKLKRGIVKVWWDSRDEETREEYEGQTPVGLALLQDDSEMEIIEQKAYPDEEDAKQRQQAMEQLQQQLDHALSDKSPQAGMAVQQIQARMTQIQSMPPAMLYDVTCKRRRKGGKICVENVPPEEFLISRKAKDIQNAPFVGHRVLRTLSELRSMGYKGVEDLASDDTENTSLERMERLSFDDEYADMRFDSSDESQRQVWVTECYLRCDYDGDGIAELRKVCRAGGVILSNDVVDIIPFVSICPIPEPHKFYGLSVADLAMEGQKTETALLRSTLDNLYLEVNGRYFAEEGQVNLDDLLSSRPGGIVRIKRQGAVGRLDQGKGNVGETLGMLEFMKGFNEDSTGWSRMSQGNDPSSLNKNETATKTNIVTNKADMRVDLIARNFAEGFVDLFRMMLKLVCQHQSKQAAIKLNGEWIEMDPREWRNQFDVSINVGLGVGNKDQQVQHLMTLQQAQGNGLALGIASPQTMYESCVELARAMGFKSAEKFFAKPDPNKPPPNPMQGQMQIEQMKAQMAAQTKSQETQAQMQLERERMQMQAQVDQHRQQVEAEQQAMKIQNEKELAMLREQLADQRAQREAAMEYEKAVAIARINASAKLDAAQVQAQSTLTAQQESATDAATND